MKNKTKSQYSFGEVFSNKYLNTTITEVLNSNKKRVGYIWKQSDGTIIVSPHLGLYVWFGPNGDSWSIESAAKWLVFSD